MNFMNAPTCCAPFGNDNLSKDQKQWWSLNTDHENDKKSSLPLFSSMHQHFLKSSHSVELIVSLFVPSYHRDSRSSPSPLPQKRSTCTAREDFHRLGGRCVLLWSFELHFKIHKHLLQPPPQ